MNKFLDYTYWLYLLDALLKKPNVANGLLPDKIKPEDRVHDPVLGEAKKSLLPSKNWKPYRSTGEEQKRPDSSETFACVTYSALNPAEQIMNRMKAMVANNEADEETRELVKIFNYFEFYNDRGEADLSDPFTAKMSNTSYRGNTYENVYYSIRHDGLVAEKYWPTPETYTWNEYFKVILQAVKDRGKQFTDYVEVIYERFNDFQGVKEYSPCTASVHAGGDWNTDGVKQRTSLARNHSIDNDYFEDGRYDGIFDSYQPYDKKVTWNYGMGAGRILTFKLKKSLKNKFETLLEGGTKYIIRAENKGEFYKVTPTGFEYYLRESIDNAIADDTDLNTNLKELTKQKKIMWVNEDWFNKMSS